LHDAQVRQAPEQSARASDQLRPEHDELDLRVGLGDELDTFRQRLELSTLGHVCNENLHARARFN